LLVKLLIPSASAGIILGKGGETIICLQSQYCTNIQLSKAGDFFPGLLTFCFRINVLYFAALYAFNALMLLAIYLARRNLLQLLGLI